MYMTIYSRVASYVTIRVYIYILRHKTLLRGRYITNWFVKSATLALAEYYFRCVAENAECSISHTSLLHLEVHVEHAEKEHTGGT